VSSSIEVGRARTGASIVRMTPKHDNEPAKGGQKGFGLIEQIMTLTVLAVLATIAVPAFHQMIEGHQLRVAQTDYIVALQHARNLAVNEQRQIIFCPSRDGQRCNGDGSWTGGWLIGRHDLDNKGQPYGSPLYIGGHYSGKVIVAGSEAKKYIAFKADGSATGNQTLTFCIRDEAQRPLNVVIALRGRIKGEAATSADPSPCTAPD